MRQALNEVRAAFSGAVRLVALSNTSKVHWDFVTRRYPIFDLLDDWVVSYDEGVAKPEPEIYQRFMERHTGGRPPLYFTDDIPRYVEGAQAVGWDAEVFQGAEHFTRAVLARM